MGRWQPDGRGRLHEAALELYSEKGFDETTVAEIAERAGLTERTFYRYFADKREVLFGGAALLGDHLLAGVAGAPAGASALEAAAAGLDAAAAMVGQGRRDLARRRNAVIAANPSLRERELSKLADYAASIAGALHERGVAETQAALAADVAMSVLRLGMQRWAADDDGPELSALLRASMADLRPLAAGLPRVGRSRARAKPAAR